MKSIDVTSDSYAEYNEDSNKKILDLKLVIMLEFQNKNLFAKGYTQNWLEEVFFVSQIKNTVPWTYVISDMNGEPITGSFYEKEFQKSSQENLE